MQVNTWNPNLYHPGASFDVTWSSPDAPKNDSEWSELRVTFNRPLTWSERESFRVFVDESLDGTHRFQDPGVVFVAAAFESRQLMKEIQAYVANAYVNVHPRAVKTIDPEVVV